MSAIRQILLSLAVIGLVGFLWFRFFPGGREFVEQLDLYKMLTSSGEQTSLPSSGDNSATGSAKPAREVTPAPGGRGGMGRGDRITSVVVKPAMIETINTRITALGTGVALHSVTVQPRASGRLTEVLVQAGQDVQVGDILAHLDATAQTISFDKAQLALEDAKATLARTQSLIRSKSVSETQVQQAQLAVSNAELSLRSAEVDLQNRSIVAPIGGTVGLVQVSVGNEVSATSIIATIEDDTAILVNFWLPEVLVGSVRIGDAAEVVPVARPDISFPAKVVGIDNKVDTASGTYEVQARLENSGRNLRAGMSFSVLMSFPGEAYVAVDPLSILWGADGAYVWRLAGETVEKVSVKVIQRNSETVLVSGDLDKGDLIVSEGLEGLMPGTKVKIFDQPAAPLAGREEAASGDEAAKSGAAQAATAAGN